MSAIDPPRCPICGQAHWARFPHQFGKVNPHGDRRHLVRPIAEPNTSANEAKGRKAENARRDSSADCSSSRITARAGGKPAKNTSREGRRVLKAKATRSDREHLEAQPATATPGKPAGRQGIAAKPSPGKRKTARKAA